MLNHNDVKRCAYCGRMTDDYQYLSVGLYACGDQACMEQHDDMEYDRCLALEEKGPEK